MMNNIVWNDLKEINFGGAYISRYSKIEIKKNTEFQINGAPSFLYFDSGQGFYWINQEEKKQYQENSILLIKEKVKIHLESDQTGECYILNLLHVDEWIQSILTKELCLYLLSDERIEQQFYLLWKYITNDMQQNLYSLSKELYQLLMNVDEAINYNKSNYTLWVQEALQIIKEEYAFLEGIDEIADIIGCSKSHFIRTFKKEVGESPGQYLQQIRLSNASILLKSESFTIDVIANMVGYSCANYFCKVFQKQFGESPGQYRKRNAAQVKQTEKESIQKILNMYQI